MLHLSALGLTGVVTASRGSEKSDMRPEVSIDAECLREHLGIFSAFLYYVVEEVQVERFKVWSVTKLVYIDCHAPYKAGNVT